MAHVVRTVAEFDAWFRDLDASDQNAVARTVAVLEEFGPQLGRPKVDTLKGTSLAGLKELRVRTIRVLFVFDPQRQAVLLLGGDKTGDRRWYVRNIPLAEARYARYLDAESKKP